MVDYIGQVRKMLDEFGSRTSTFIKMCEIGNYVRRELRQPDKEWLLTDPVELLESGVGNCSHKCIVFAWLTKEILGVEVQSVQLLHSNGIHGHVVATAKIDGRDCYFDPTYSAYAQVPLTALYNWPDLVAELYSNCPWEKRENGDGIEGFFKGNPPALRPL